MLFFAPVVVAYLVIDYAVLQIPQSYQNKAAYLNTHGQSIQVASFGSSQMQNAINPEFLDVEAINFGSTSQHHKLDFEILKQIKDRLPNLKTVIFEVSYSHFELPHNSDEFWKNTVYYNFFDVNAFNRKTYFKDRLLFISRPDFYAKALKDFYFTKKNVGVFNTYGYKTNDTLGKFFKLKYNTNRIAKQGVEIHKKQNNAAFKINTAYFENIVKYTKEHNLSMVIVTLPMYTTFLRERNPSITFKRDSVLLSLKNKYSNLRLYSKEEDTVSYNVLDFKNESHLNSFGAEKYTKALNSYLSN